MTYILIVAYLLNGQPAEEPFALTNSMEKCAIMANAINNTFPALRAYCRPTGDLM